MRWLLILTAFFSLVACDGISRSNPFPDGVVPMITGEERDIERPDIFNVTDRGLWDGRPSFGGIWVAHPDVREPQRVLIRHMRNGQSTVGDLYRRERENPGPVLQLSSDAAEALGILAGAPTELNIVALRREEVIISTNPIAKPLSGSVGEWLKSLLNRR